MTTYHSEENNIRFSLEDDKVIIEELEKKWHQWKGEWFNKLIKKSEVQYSSIQNIHLEYIKHRGGTLFSCKIESENGNSYEAMLDDTRSWFSISDEENIDNYIKFIKLLHETLIMQNTKVRVHNKFAN